MNLEQIEKDIKKLVSNVDRENFIYDFLLAYGLPKSSINRLKKGDYNKSKNEGEIIWAKKVYFKTTSENEDVHDVIDEISKSDVIEKQKIRFIIVTDFKTFLSKDIKTSDTLDIEISNLSENFSVYELVDNSLARKQKKILNILNENNFSSEDCILILRIFLVKLKRLLKIQQEVEKEKNVEKVISSYKPPIFWKEKDVIKEQIKLLNLEKIHELIVRVNGIELLIKKHPSTALNVTTDFILDQTQ